MNEQECTLLVKRRAISYDQSFPEDSAKLPCEHCGWWDYLERHHRKFRSRGGLWTPANIILLCHRCHERTTVERLPGVGLNLSERDVPTRVPVFLWYVDGYALLTDLGGFIPCEVDKD